MEKYGVDDVQQAQREALARARARHLELCGVLQKTGSQSQELKILEDHIAELEEALGQ
jgi:diaminopimelate decarboxylase